MTSPNYISNPSKFIYFNKLKFLLDKIKEPSQHLLILSEQISEAGIRRFFMIDRQQFLETHDLLDEFNTFYEIIRSNIPVKPFLDLEYQVELNPDLNPTHLLNKIKISLAATILEDHGVEIHEADILILTSSNHRKQSFHLIVDHDSLRIPNIMTLGLLVHRTILHCETEGINLNIRTDGGHGSFVDLSVYSKNQNMRLFGSRKLGSDRVLKLDDRDTHHLILATSPEAYPRGGLSKLILKASLITASSPNSSTTSSTLATHKTSPTTTMITSSTTTSTTTTKTTSSPNISRRRLEAPSITPEISEHILQTTGSQSFTIVKTLNEDIHILKLLPKPTCPTAGRTHRHNNTYVTINMGSRCWWISCRHPSCQKQTNMHHNLPNSCTKN